ncbi:5298_t:CDS:1, partial [Acaulospora colombiana]
RQTASTLSPSTAAQTKRRGVFSSTKTCLKTRFQSETIYFTTILFASDGKVLVTSGSKVFPTIEVIRNNKLFGNLEDDSDEFSHAMRTSLDWTISDDTLSDTDSLHSNSSTGESTDSTSQNYHYNDHDNLWSRSFSQASLKLKGELSLESLGTMYEHVVSMNLTKSKFIVTIQHVPNGVKEEISPDLIKAGILKWKNSDEISNIYQKDPHPVWINYIDSWCSRQAKLLPGLYLGVLYTESTLQGIKILVPKGRKQLIPLDKIRDEATITPEEASWIKSLTCLSQDCFIDLASSTRVDENVSNLGQFQASFVDSYNRLQRETNLTWEVSDIYNEQTVDIYLDSQTNRPYTMMNELEDNIIDQYGTSHGDLYLDHNAKIGPKSSTFSKRSSKLSQQINLGFDENEEKSTLPNFPESHKAELELCDGGAKLSANNSDNEIDHIDHKMVYEEDISNTIDDKGVGNEIKFKGKDVAMHKNNAVESEEEEEVMSNVKSSNSTGVATSVAEEATSALASILSFNNINSIRPFARIVLIVKPMRQPHQIRDAYVSGSCMLYPFPLYDALQHATFNASLYACSRRSMQILQASRVYFTRELVRHLQNIDNFSEVNEQNIEDYFFDPDEFLKIPDEARKIQQALDIIRDEVVTLRQQWNIASWTMTAIEWDRQRTMQSYNFGGRPMTLNVSSRNSSQSRAASVHNVHLSNSCSEDNDENSEAKGAKVIKNDATLQIEFLRDLMYHAPDRAWNHIRFLGIPLPTFNNNLEAISGDSRINKQKKQNNKSSSNTPKGTTCKPPPPILMSYLSSLPALTPMVPEKKRLSTSSAISSSSSNSINSNNSTTAPPLLPVRKQSASRRLMKTLGLVGRGQQNTEPELPPIPNQLIANHKENGKRKLSSKRARGLHDKSGAEDNEESIIINVPLTTSPLLAPSFLGSNEKIGDELEVDQNVIRVDNASESVDNSQNYHSVQDVEKNIDSKDLVTESVESRQEIDAQNNIEPQHKHVPFEIKIISDESLEITTNESTISTVGNTIVAPEAVSMVDSEAFFEGAAGVDTNENNSEDYSNYVGKDPTELLSSTNVDKANSDAKEPTATTVEINDQSNVEDEMHQEAIDAIIDAIIDVNCEVSKPLEEDTENLIASLSNNSQTLSINSTSTSASTTTTTSATDTPLSSRASSSPSTPQPPPPPSSPINESNH